MAKWSFALQGWTPTAVADATNFTDNGHQSLQGGSSTQRIDVYEIEIGGLAGSSTPCPMVFARHSTVGASLTALTTAQSNGALDPATAALAAPQQPYTASTTKPQRSATAARIALGINAFGGISRWVAAPGGEFKMLGNTASNGEAGLSAFTGGTTGLMNSHIMYETY